MLFYCHVRTFAFLFIQPAVTLFCALSTMAHILQLLFAATATNFMFVTICIHESANYQFKPLFTH